MLNYLDRTFPSGTPIEELDVEVFPSPAPPDQFPRPIIEFWEVASFQGTFSGHVGALASLISPSPGLFPNTTSRTDAFYKHPLELWLDVLRDEYETNVARSPLERGVLLSETRTLDTCFAFSEGALKVSNSSASVVPLAPLGIKPPVVDIGGVRSGTLEPNEDVRARGVEVVTRWNALEQQLANILNNRRTFPKDLKLNDLSVVNVFVERWAKLDPQDPDNLNFDAAVSALGLNAEHGRLLKSAGATDLRLIARSLLAAPNIESYNSNVKPPPVKSRPKGARKSKSASASSAALEPISFPISAAKADEMRQAISAAMGKSPTVKK
jgi:hypothetical protein